MMSNKWILIENKGVINPHALSLMGASTKREDSSKLGFFGSGNKYAMALLLRNNIPFKIYAGLEEIVVGTVDVPFRESEFKQITINGEKTSLTTDMGPGWEPWMIIREYVQNSRDEEQSNIIATTEVVGPKEGFTRFYIQHNEAIIDVVNNWDKYFTFDRDDVLVTNIDGRLYPQVNYEDQGLYLFKRGIRCYTGATKAMYQYDLQDFGINESRVVENIYDASNKCAAYLCKYATIEVATNILHNAFVSENKWYEAGLDYYHWGINRLNDNWEQALAGKVVVVHEVSGFYMDILTSKSHYQVSRELAKAIRTTFKDIEVYGLGEGDQELISKPVSRTSKMEYMLKKVQEFFTEIQYIVTADIQIVEFNVDKVLGNAGKSHIELSSKLFDRGMKELAMTIMEEQEHIRTGFKDKTREFQDHLFRMLLTEKEERYGIFL